jgi:phosphatidylinositol alpha-1,6-mannosyltransferase
MHPREREKGHRQLLRVWPEITREFPEAQLVFAGPGEDREAIARTARESGVGESVFLPGEVSPGTLQQLFAGCYAFTMPSRQEGFGLVYLEAMNWAKPCLGCFDDGAEDVILHEQTGLLIRDQNDSAELAGALRRLLGRPDEARQMGLRGFERLKAGFTSAHVQRRICDNLGRVL